MEALAKKRCSFARLLFFLSTPSAPGSAATTKGATPVDEEHGCLLSLARRAEERERTRNKLSEVSVFFGGGGFLFRLLSLSLREMDGGGCNGFFSFHFSLFHENMIYKKKQHPRRNSLYTKHSQLTPRRARRTHGIQTGGRGSRRRGRVAAVVLLEPRR